jgi:hypothetical protein
VSRGRQQGEYIMPATLVNSAAGTAAKSFSFAQRQLRFFKVAMLAADGTTAVSLAAEFGSDSVTASGGDDDNTPGLVQQVVQVLQNYGTIEHMRVGDSAATDGFIFAALDVGGSEEVDGATWVPRLAGGSATTLPAAIQADVRVIRSTSYNSSGVLQALGTAGTTAGKDGGTNVTGSTCVETGLVLT